MKTKIFSFMALLILTAMPAFAEETGNSVHLPTQKYVNDGLIEVYQRAKNLNTATNTRITNLKDYVGDPSNSETNTPATGLTKKVEELSTNLAGFKYEGDEGRGIYVSDDRKIGVSGLTSVTGSDPRMYVFQGNTAVPLGTADTWIDPEPLVP